MSLFFVFQGSIPTVCRNMVSLFRNLHSTWSVCFDTYLKARTLEVLVGSTCSEPLASVHDFLLSASPSPGTASSMPLLSSEMSCQGDYSRQSCSGLKVSPGSALILTTFTALLWSWWEVAEPRTLFRGIHQHFIFMLPSASPCSFLFLSWMSLLGAGGGD